MAPTSCSEPQYSPSARATLLAVAKQSITTGLNEGHQFEPKVGDYAPELQQSRACFVTLELAGELRGCIGSLQARQPLVAEVARNAYASAFEDPRFPPLDSSELGALQITISVLSVPEPMSFRDEQDLINQLRPGIDGLILRDGLNAGTYLPSVWQKLPTPEQFFGQLKLKAGLRPDHWSERLTVERYTTEAFSSA